MPSQRLAMELSKICQEIWIPNVIEFISTEGIKEAIFSRHSADMKRIGKILNIRRNQT